VVDERPATRAAVGDGSKNKLILGASWTTQSKPTELQDTLQTREPHLDLLTLTA
jgi:hypothetical protein